MTALVSRIDAAAGRVDALVNSAGGVAGQTMQAIEQVTDEDWHVILAINLDGAFHFTRAAAPAMKRAGRGAIVNISSGAGRSYSLTGIQAYASAKAGLIGFTRQTARELGAHGIRVNCVAPASCARIRRPSGSGKPWVRRARGACWTRSPSPGWACPRRSRGPSAYVTGQTISVDGGHWMLG